MDNAFFESESCEILFNPKMKHLVKETPETLKSFGLRGHVWLSTSGSTGERKWVALSKEAILSSATHVNEHLEATAKDTWLVALPSFHVGGLGIYARSYLIGSKLLEAQGKWDAESFVKMAEHATLTALVPTQIFDLIFKKLKCPKNLRACIVGGGQLSSLQYQQGKKLGWPLLPSYGLTECASQVATAKLGSKVARLQPLSHISLALSKEGQLKIKSPALLTAYFFNNHLFDPKIDGWLQTEDYATLKDGHVEILGRGGDFIKVLGESVSLLHLQTILDAFRLQHHLTFDAVIFSKPDPRQENSINLATTAKEASLIKPLLDAYDAATLPFERISRIVFLTKLPKSPLKKVLKGELRRLID